jgi:hypothetical protein
MSGPSPKIAQRRPKEKGITSEMCRGRRTATVLWFNLMGVSRTVTPMLDRSSDDEASRQILGVFMRYRVPANGMLLRNYFSMYVTAIFNAGSARRSRTIG